MRGRHDRAAGEHASEVPAIVGLAAQIAREIFKVPRVITRIYDPMRQDVYTELGLDTVCPTLSGASQIHSMLKG